MTAHPRNDHTARAMIGRRRFLYYSGVTMGLAGGALAAPAVPAAAGQMRGPLRGPGSSSKGTYLIPEDFGADVTAADNSDALQAALDASAATGEQLIMNNDYFTTKPLYLPSHVRWSGTGRVTNTAPDLVFGITVLPGNYHPAYWDQLTYFTGGAVVEGAYHMTLDVPAETSNFAVGDIVFNRSDAHTTLLRPDNNPPNDVIIFPHYGSFNRIVAINTTSGRIDFEFPWLRAVDVSMIAHADNSIIDFHGLRTLYCAYDAQVDGIRLESVNASAIARGSTLGSTIHWGELRGQNGLFTNSVCFSDVSVDSIIVDRKIIDIAGNSVGSQFHINQATYTKTARSVRISLIALNESMHDLTIDIGTINADGYDFDTFAVRMSRVSGIDVTIDALNCAGLTGSVVSFINALDDGPGDTQFVTRDNTVTITSFTGGSSLQSFARYDDPGGHLIRCNLNGNFVATPLANAIGCDGTGHTIRGTYSAGDLELGDATDLDIDVDLGGNVIGCPDPDSTVIVNGNPVTC
ncbi:hypothetical protein E0H73_40910 [Kribbella pittospori]|uniref:Right-handed parallel beta-helix repeat-containing protein n=1 Tax=Kribbella pittospori TaxID=722689 RepID=A0A4R0JYW5_9ACTN|nr:hypothetical protein [Kribbella pittospori]TCC51484.1 hypothetical protein E0H73_40910 [Kribbella pittospori]